MNFLVKKGKHWFKPMQYRIYWKRTKLKAEFNFNESCLYNSAYGQWNKLVGLSDFNTSHSNHSVRIGWRGSNGSNIELCLYTRVDKEWKAKSIGFVNVNEWNSAEIEISKKEYIVRFNGYEHRESRKLRRMWGVNYFLQPYFGGANTAFHDMNINLTWV